jgi:hypothetical protein
MRREESVKDYINSRRRRKKRKQKMTVERENRKKVRGKVGRAVG